MAETATSRAPIAITGIGILTSLGEGREENWRALTAGRSGIHRIGRFSVEGMRTTIGGSIEYLGIAEKETPYITLEIARRAVREALEQSAIGTTRRFPGRTLPRGAADRAGVADPPRDRPRGRRDELRRHDARPRRRIGAPASRFPERLRRRPAAERVRHPRHAGDRLDGMRLGGERDPARRRGDPARRGDRGARGRCRRLDPARSR